MDFAKTCSPRNAFAGPAASSPRPTTMASSRYERSRWAISNPSCHFPGCWHQAIIQSCKGDRSPRYPSSCTFTHPSRHRSGRGFPEGLLCHLLPIRCFIRAVRAQGSASGSTPYSEQYDEDRAGPRTPCASSDEDLVAAFLSTSQVYPVLCALVRRQQPAVTSPRRHANGDCRQTLAGTGCFPPCHVRVCPGLLVWG